MFRQYRSATSNGIPALEPLEPRLLLSGSVLLSEFMADNNSTLADEDGDYPDWLEVQNAGTSGLSLLGWKLKDSGNEWTFPDVWLAPGAHRVVFASDKNRRDPLGELHASFKLSAGGEYLALLDPSGAVVQEYAPAFPEQLEDTSYGVLYEEHGTQTLIQKGDPAQYVVATGPVNPAWTAVGFDDATWTSGTTGFGFGLGGGPVGDVTLIEAGATWKYLDDGSNQGTAWRQSAFNDAAWAAGPAQLGYGDGDEATVVSFGGNGSDKHITTYFRHDFDVTHAWAYTGLTLRIQRDDGAVVYLNGQEVARSNMPTTAVDYQTRSASVVGGADENTFFEFTIDPTGLLSEGENTLAVEIHQTSTTSSDISFDLELIGQTNTSELIETDLQAAMQGVGSSLLVRVPFTVSDPAELSDLTLEVAYEDGYVAYLNGTRVAVRNAPATPSWNSVAASDRAPADAFTFEGVDLTEWLDLLQPGENILALHALNDASADGDFLVCPRLTGLAGVTVTEQYFTTPTPGAANVPGVGGVVADTQFSVDRGFFDEPFQVEITTTTPGAEIRYTLDGSEPTAGTGTVYTGPIDVTTTAILRAAAFKPGWLPTNVDTQTYLFLADVLNQPSDPAGFPISWASEPADYEMDPEIVNSTMYGSQLLDALTSLPSISIVADVDDLFGASEGIYANPTAQGVAWERPASMELIDPDGEEGFQVNAGLRIYGGVGRQARFKKHTFRFLFKDEYGPTKLRYPFFGEDATQEFDTITLRSGFNDAWVWGGTRTQYIRDEYARQLQLALGGVAGHGNFMHLYVNGLYWGLYNPTERPEASFSASYLGGEKEDYDALNSGQVTDGNSTAWNTVRNLASQGFETMAKYQRLQGNNPDGTNNPAYENYLDVDQYIIYMLMNFYTGNRDWPGHNWYGARMRGPDSAGWHFYSWDAEWTVNLNSGINENRTGVNNSCTEIYAALRANEEFRLRFGDIAHQAFFNNGPYSSSAAGSLYNDLAETVELAVIAESARWGDAVTSSPYTASHWANERSYILGTYLPQRSSVVLQQLRDIGLYPGVTAPSFHLNAQPQHGGAFSPGDTLTISAPAGTIYYTTDGTDPRELGGAVSATAQVYTGGLPLTLSGNIRARARTAAGEWSAVNEAAFYDERFPPVRITEMNYHPAPPSEPELEAGFTDGDEF